MLGKVGRVHIAGRHLGWTVSSVRWNYVPSTQGNSFIKIQSNNKKAYAYVPFDEIPDITHFTTPSLRGKVVGSMNFYSNKGFIIPSVVIPRLIQERLDGLQVLKPMEETRQAMNVMYADCVHDSTIKSISNDKLHSVLKDVKLIVSRNILRQILTTCNKPKHNAQFFRRRNFQLRASNINGKVILTTVYTYENRPAPFPSYGRELRRIAAPYLTLHGDIVTDHHNADTSYYRVMEATLGNFSLLVRHYVDAVDEQGQPVLLKAARSLPESQVADYFLNMWGQLALSDNAYAWFVRVGREGIVSSKEKLYGTDLLARAGLTEEDGKVMLAKLVEVLKWITATVPHSGGQVILTYSPYTNAFGLKHPFERVDIMSPEVARMIS